MSFFDNEIAYLSAFCDAEPLPCGVRLRDARMPDMYSHNLTCVRDALPEAPLTELTVREIARRCAQGADFLNLTLHFAPEQPWLDALPDGCEHTRYGCYTLHALRGTPRSDCEIAQMTPETEPAARVFALAVNGADMGEDFVARRFDRRALVYRTGAAERWLCLYRGRIAGVCDLFVHDDAAKLEDFDVHPDFQRQGFGTALLHALTRRAQSLGARTIYLVTDEADTAREMYVKNGFQKTAEKHEFLFYLQSEQSFAPSL